MSRPENTAKEIFFLALDTEPARRAALLEDLCAGDTDLRRHVEALLRVHDEPNSYLDNSRIDLGFGGDAIAASGEAEARPMIEGPGTQIGPYELVEQIGEGGMGVVYMAQQTEPVERRVALKIIKPGMDSKQVIARFEVERQALAMMDHPNIAKVHDAGTTDTGRPYFVMELVSGVPVTRFCDEQRLTARERLELFIPICRAVHHAHQKGIIHRDIKPGNILVTCYDGQPVPKVIDSGVAKTTGQRLTEKTMFTTLGQIIGTVEYMSPEQAQQKQSDIDARTDVYSLGVVLYELLVGDTPYDRQRLRAAAIDELLRIIREEEPPNPSAKLSSSGTLPAVAARRNSDPARLNSLVRGKLDWIVMKALEKDRARRYESARSLAADVEHFLKGEPVDARAPPTANQLRNVKGQIVRMAADATLIQLALFVAFVLRLFYLVVIEDASTVPEIRKISLAYVGSHLNIAWRLTAVCLIVFYCHGFYTRGRYYQSRYKTLVVSQAVTLGYICFVFLTYFFSPQEFEAARDPQVFFPRGAFVLGWFFTVILLVGARIWAELWRATST